jgi:acetyl-CoA carboxylase carboxyl transferase subunit alpha
MLENAIYSVISPEGCASIMWKDAARRQQAAAAMRITAADVKELGCIDDIIPEPEGGTQADAIAAMNIVGRKLSQHLAELKAMPLDAMLDARYNKFRNMAQFYTTA